MYKTIQSVWTNFISPLYQRPLGLQLAALCHREGDDGREVLLVTSSRGRWILPKGWPIDGLTAAQAAQREAWEEGGIKKGTVSKTSVGSFLTKKHFASGAVLPCETKVFSIAVRDVTRKFPEAKRRKRIWVSPQKAAEMVDEAGLKSLLTKF